MKNGVLGDLVYTRINTGFVGILGQKRKRGVYTLTEKTKVLTVRVPTDLYEWLKRYNMRELLTNLRDECRTGEIDIVDDYIVTNTESDLDGEWVREMAHDLNVEVKTFKRKVEGMR